jgi:hypothetical protein
MKKKRKFIFLLGFLCFSLTNLSAQETEEKFHHVIWENEINVNIQGNEITKTSNTGWNGGMFSKNKLNADSDGRIQHKVQDQSKYYMFGFSQEDKDAHYKSINYAWYVRPNYAYIYINGRYSLRLRGKVGETLELEKRENIILFKKDGVVVYEAEIETEEAKSFYVDVSIYKTGTFKFEVEATFEPHYTVSKWRSTEGLSISNNTITKDKSQGWNAGFFSEGKIPSKQDGFIEHEVINQSRYYMVGLSSENKSTSYKTINYAWYVRLGYAYIYKNGSYQARYKSGVGDLLRIERIGNTLYMMKNNVTMRKYDVDIEEDLHVDASLYQSGIYSIPIWASFPNPSASYAILKKKLDGGYAVFEGDVKFKFIQEYAVTSSATIDYNIYNWARQIVNSGILSLEYGVNWYSIPTNSAFINNQTYILEIEGNKGETYFLKFKYKTNRQWEDHEVELSDN